MSCALLSDNLQPRNRGHSERMTTDVHTVPVVCRYLPVGECEQVLCPLSVSLLPSSLSLHLGGGVLVVGRLMQG